MADGEADPALSPRRGFLSGLSAAAIAGLAGCGFGGDGDRTTIPPITTLPPERTPTETPADTFTTPPTQSPTTSTSTTTTDDLLEGRTWRLFAPPPKPADVTYNPRHGDAFWFDGRNTMRLDLFRRSVIDLQFYQEAAEDWNYKNGVLTVKLHDDLYWVSDQDDIRNPIPVTAEDWVEATWFHEGLFLGGSRIAEMERDDDHRFRVFYTEPFATRHALDRTMRNFTEAYNATYWRSYLDRFADATTDDERSAIKAEAYSEPVPSPHPVSNMPFRVAETTADRWRLTLRTDEDNVPRWVQQLTYPSVEIVVRPEISRQTAAFRTGELPFAGMRQGDPGGDNPRLNFDPAVIDIDVDFPTTTLTLPRRFVPGCYLLNSTRHPTDNVHFRRAFAYLLDRAAHRTQFMEGDRIITGFTTERDERRYISSGLLTTLENGPYDNYGYSTVKRDAAEAELKAGGFERDSQGQWLYQSGSSEGEPIVLQIPAYPWMDRLIDASTKFTDTLTAFGIEASVEPQDHSTLWDDLDDGRFTIALGYWGGRLPETVFDIAFAGYTGFHGDVGIGDTWEGPPVGEFATPPDMAQSETTTYDIEFLMGNLWTLPDDLVSVSVDKLAWVYNQSMMNLPIGHQPWIWTLNTQSWDWPLPPGEQPSKWPTIPRGKFWQHGFAEAVAAESQ